MSETMMLNISPTDALLLFGAYVFMSIFWTFVFTSLCQLYCRFTHCKTQTPLRAPAPQSSSPTRPRTEPEATAHSACLKPQVGTQSKPTPMIRHNEVDSPLYVWNSADCSSLIPHTDESCASTQTKTDLSTEELIQNIHDHLQNLMDLTDPTATRCMKPEER